MKSRRGDVKVVCKKEQLRARKCVCNGLSGLSFFEFLCADRYAEFLIFGGILLWNADHDNLLWVAVCVAAMMGAFLVPYTRAKGEIFGLDMRLGIMSRLERYIVLVVCLLIGFPNIAMAVIAVFANITAIQRLLHMKKNLG